MAKVLDIHAWIKEVEAARSEMNALVALLQNYDSQVHPENSPEVGSLPYIVKFLFENGVVITIRMILKDWQTDSDVVITNMTTLPQSQRKRGFGKKAVRRILQWARDNHLNEVRATQVSEFNEGFWLKNGFRKCGEPNPCNDFVFTIG